MNFNSQICTTKEQSERLLALGLRRETADCSWDTVTLHGTPITYPSQESWMDYSIISDNHFPAWSLHRLIEMMPQGIQDCSYRCFALAVNSQGVSYEYHFIDKGIGYNDLIGCTDLFDNLYDDIIAHIEWLIKEGYFNKEYLE